VEGLTRGSPEESEAGSEHDRRGKQGLDPAGHVPGPARQHGQQQGRGEHQREDHAPAGRP